ncbi:hypothetical protein [Staphylococcus sp. EZ-P03]|uniref:hypothetical protein n=1 Tax=Staphylococcus sp. EZ-P03 TaxID=2282739 RepID=UPI001968E406|nr:hypothetical protein [Staphylococcus sp. EZ-P03]
MKNTITERDKIELCSYWTYQDYTMQKDFDVNVKKFKIVDEYHANENTNGLIKNKVKGIDIDNITEEQIENTMFIS